MKLMENCKMLMSDSITMKEYTLRADIGNIDSMFEYQIQQDNIPPSHPGPLFPLLGPHWFNQGCV